MYRIYDKINKELLWVEFKGEKHILEFESKKSAQDYLTEMEKKGYGHRTRHCKIV